MHPSPPNPPDPFGNDRSEQQIDQRFILATGELWNLAIKELVSIQPEDWNGFQCVVDAEWNPHDRQFHFNALFRDTASNRSKWIKSTQFHLLIGALHVVYRRFSERLEWKRVVFDRTWNEEEKKWKYESARTYGRTVRKPDQSDPDNIGLS
jgi:tRNA G10  N-methylase Trm11